MENAKLSKLAAAIDDAGFEVVSLREETALQLLRELAPARAILEVEGTGVISHDRTGSIFLEVVRKA